MTDDILDETRLRELQARTRELPREIMPPADAWVAIRARIAESDGEPESGETAENAGDTAGSAEKARSQTRRALALWQRPVFLAAAAAMLVAGSSIVTAIALGGSDGPVTERAVASSEAPREAPRRSSSAPATLAEFTVLENDYIGTANRLAALLESDETQLSPETIAKLKASLRVIDAAILEARRALAADPANRELVEMLSASYNHKLDLLRRTTEMGRS